jgi:hypothetical protein
MSSKAATLPLVAMRTLFGKAARRSRDSSRSALSAASTNCARCVCAL